LLPVDRTEAITRDRSFFEKTSAIAAGSRHVAAARLASRLISTAFERLTCDSDQPSEVGNRMKLDRRRFLKSAFWAMPCAPALDLAVEAEWLRIRRIRLGTGAIAHRFVQFTDVHFKGREDYFQHVVDTINGLKPDFALFTGDLIERARFAPKALEYLGKLQMPLYGVPGNHDHWSRAPFGAFKSTFAATGGAWMQDEQRFIRDGRVQLVGMDRFHYRCDPIPGAFNILMVHYPGWVDYLPPRNGAPQFDLILAGHTHGGQVRLPFYGALVTPFDTNGYEMGWYDTPPGPLYVNPGIGTLSANIRFNCRPELTLFEVGAGKPVGM
jgi:predicted phosphodiesterase